MERTPVIDALIRGQLAEASRDAKPLLRWAGTELSRGIGSLHAWVPVGTSRAALGSLRVGLAATGRRASDPFVPAVRETLSKHAEGVLVTEDQLSLPGDSWLLESAGLAGEVVAVAEVVYHIVRRRDLSLEDEHLSGLVNLGRCGWQGIGALCLDSGLLQTLKAGGGELEQLSASDAAIESIWFDAYDGDGYIEWSLAGRS